MASFQLDDQVLVQETMFVRTLTLNRPRQLNTLSLEMISHLLELFLAYEDDANAKLIILKGRGRAFCAGGNLAAVHRHFLEGNLKYGEKVSQKIINLTYLIATYNKPQVSILNGIAMGAGVGISVHGKFRVATENSIFATPENGLGFFPNVGASYFLSRFPGFFGEYLGLTGARLDGAEMLACGLATHFVPSAKLPLLEKALISRAASATSSSFDLAFISAIIDEHSLQQPALNEKSALHKMDFIDKCFSRPTVEEILSALEREAAEAYMADDDHRHEWLALTIRLLKKASPMSLKICLRSIREGRVQAIDECLVREYRITSHILRGQISKDFREGCRAIVWDKDKKPKWKPSSLELITDHMVDHYFSRLDDDEELKLPQRSNLPAFANAKL